MMELIEIEGLFEMDTGAPSPMVISNDNDLILTFYADKQAEQIVPQQRNTIHDTGIFALKFDLYLKYSFGIPGNETLQGHLYGTLGIRSYSFYELRGSAWIRELENIGKLHAYYNPEKWKEYKHYILTFHDNMFECIAKGFEIREENVSLYNQATSILNEISLRDF